MPVDPTARRWPIFDQREYLAGKRTRAENAERSGARLLGVQEVVGSNPAAPTNQLKWSGIIRVLGGEITTQRSTTVN